MTVKKQLQTILALIIVLSNIAYGQNYDRETKHAESIEETLIIGDSVYLSSPEEPDHQFISLLTEADSDNKTAIIIVHGSGIHPNWADLIHPLRANLPDLGYTTLAIQMPVPSLNADYNAYPSLFPLAKNRLETAQDYLLAKGYENIYIIAHSMGAGMSSWSLAPE